MPGISPGKIPRLIYHRRALGVELLLRAVTATKFFHHTGSLRLHRTALSSAPPRRFIPAHLFIAQSDQGIDPRRASRWQQASHQANRDHDSHNSAER
jgi:hypothetical protein